MIWCHEKLLTAAVLFFCLIYWAPTAHAQAIPLTKEVSKNCANDYRKFCGDYGLGTRALNLCMRKAGPGLAPVCVNALINGGQISNAEVDRIKKQLEAEGRL